MDELSVNVLFERSDNKKIETFAKNSKSDMVVDLHYDKVEANFEWVDLMENTMRYLDNILRNPNRFIINEEEVVKIEQSKKTGVESIKHLSKHTNLIQEINENDEITPSKILNVNKEETYETYENRFIYTLILTMEAFLSTKKRETIAGSYLKDDKGVQYKAASIVGKEKISIDLTIKTELNVKLNEKNKDGLTLAQRITKIEHQIQDLKNTVVFRTLAKAHVQIVRPPIKKTNVILKNTNFQYAMILWNYLQEHFGDESKRDKKDKNYTDEGELRDFFDETFLLDYLALCTLNKDEYVSKYEKERVVKQVIQKIIDINAGLSEDELKDMVGEQFAIIKYKNNATNEGIAKIFRKYIDKYMTKIDSIKLN